MWRLIRALVLLLVGATLGAVGAALGAATLLKDWFPSRGDESSDELELVSIFDGVELHSRSGNFRGGRALAWFGGLELDLREATIAPGARLEVRAIFGGVSVSVPDGCRVDGRGTAIMGAVDIRVPEPDDPEAPTLVVRAATVFGGIAVSR
jgi:hypothetical protein